MYQTISFRFMVVTSRIGKDGTDSLMLTIIVNKKRVSIHLKKKLKPSEFNSKTQLSTINDVNNYINIVKSRIMEIQTSFFAQKVELSAQKIKDVYNGVQLKKHWGLLELYLHHNTELKQMIGVTIAENTYDKHEYVFQLFKSLHEKLR